MYHRKAHAGAFPGAFGREERLENTFQHFWRHAMAVSLTVRRI
jgi:hypothetical protein